jgi:hypothetical protein
MESATVARESLLDACLKRIYDAPASITVVTGKWKTGKTDLSLRISYDELKNRLGIIKEAATNIKLQHPEIKYIDNFEDFEFWLFQNKRPKIFIYDEAIKSTPSRRAMSEINTKWLEYVPELSKGRCHLIVVTQEVDFTEKLFLHPTFVRAQWVKLDKTVADLIITGDQHVYRFNGIPKTTVPFDPYSIAEWRLSRGSFDFSLVDRDIKIALDYAKLPSKQVMDKYGLRYRSDLTNAVKRAIEKMYNIVVRAERNSSKEPTTTTL